MRARKKNYKINASWIGVEVTNNWNGRWLNDKNEQIEGGYISVEVCPLGAVKMY